MHDRALVAPNAVRTPSRTPASCAVAKLIRISVLGWRAAHGTASPAPADSPRPACAGSARRCRRRCRPSRTARPARTRSVQPAASASFTLRPRAPSSRVRMRSAWRRSWPWSMHSASARSNSAGVVSVASSLVSSNRPTMRRRRGQEADAPVGRQDLGEAADVDRALQAVERAQPGGVLGRDMAVGVVLDDVEVVLVGQLQHAVRAARRQAVAGRVVQHAHAHEQLGPVAFARGSSAPSPPGRARRRGAAPAGCACPARRAARTPPPSRAPRPSPGRRRAAACG